MLEEKEEDRSRPSDEEEGGFEFGVAFVLWFGGSESSSSPLDLDIVKEEDFGEREKFTSK